MNSKVEKIVSHLQTIENKWKPIPFWSWNAELEEEELRRQIRWMSETNNGGFFMHARGGLKTEYLGEDWMRCTEACADEAAPLNMGAWVYDENGWPSGFAGGKLIEREEDRDRYLTHEIGPYDETATVHYRIDGDKLVRVNENDGAAEYLNVTVCSAMSTADILNPRVVDEFLKLTHEQYAARFGEDFGKKIAGFFTDEPQYYRWGTSYTDMVAQYFRDTYNEDIFDSIGLLFVEKEGYRDFRYRYWKAMQTLMLENFAKKIYEWCDDHGMMLTGHYVEETTMGFQVMCCAGAMPFYEYEHIPGIDWLGRWSDNELAGRQIGSAAAQLGKQQVLTESFGCCGWDVTPKDLRRILGTQYVCGVNLLCQHLMPYAEYGQRKRDYPAHYSAVNPWVDDFGTFNLYISQLGRLIAESREQVNVAVLHPIRGTYFDYKRDVSDSKRFMVGEADAWLVKDMRRLSAAGVGYHFLDETLLARHGFVKDGKIGCGLCSYDYLILPHTLTMDDTTEKLLRDYVAQGGKVLVWGDKPAYLGGIPHNYDFLESNCTFEDILAAQPFSVAGTEHTLYSAYRRFEDVDFLLVQNFSMTDSCEQTFCFGENIRSFTKLDLLTMKTEQVPLTLAFEAGEMMLLFPSEQPLPQQREKKEVRFVMKDAQVSTPLNYLTIDYVRYSTDGVHFSKRYPCVALFRKLLCDRYEGEVYFKYEFEVRDLPESMLLMAETGSTGEQWLNGTPLQFTARSEVEKELWMTDVAPLVKCGTNDYTVKVNWFQSEQVYYALFGEGVTESLRNCLVYNSELEAIYLAGRFGVYSDTPYVDDPEDENYTFGDNFYVGKMPETVTEPTTDGYPFFRGVLTVEQEVEWEEGVTHLRVEGTYLTAEVWVNGQYAGKLLFDRALDIRALAVSGKNTVKVSYCISNRNLLGPHHFVDPYSRCTLSPWTFEVPETWVDDKSPMFRENYEFLKLCAK